MRIGADGKHARVGLEAVEHAVEIGERGGVRDEIVLDDDHAAVALDDLGDASDDGLRQADILGPCRHVD